MVLVLTYVQYWELQVKTGCLCICMYTRVWHLWQEIVTGCEYMSKM